MTSKRDISTINEDRTLLPVVKPIIFARLDFSSGVQRFHTEIGPKTATHPVFGSEVYTGIGDFGGLSSSVKESVSAAPANLSISLTGLDAGLVNKTLVDDYFRRDADIMIGLEDVNGDLADDPEVLFAGYMDKVDIGMNQAFSAMTLSLESRGTNLLRASDLRFTDEDKQRDFSGDLMAEYIYRMADLKLNWGGHNSTLTGPYGPEQNPPNDHMGPNK